jgi:hypothetical protein
LPALRINAGQQRHLPLAALLLTVLAFAVCPPDAFCRTSPTHRTKASRALRLDDHDHDHDLEHGAEFALTLAGFDSSSAGSSAHGFFLTSLPVEVPPPQLVGERAFFFLPLHFSAAQTIPWRGRPPPFS